MSTHPDAITIEQWVEIAALCPPGLALVGMAETGVQRTYELEAPGGFTLDLDLDKTAEEMPWTATVTQAIGIRRERHPTVAYSCEVSGGGEGRTPLVAVVTAMNDLGEQEGARRQKWCETMQRIPALRRSSEGDQ